MIKKIIYLLLFIALLSCEQKENNEICSGFHLEEATLTDSLDYEIINTILDSIYADFKYIHIEQQTYSTVNLESLKSRLDRHNIKLDTILLQNYKSQNDQEYLLGDRFDQSNVHIITIDERNCIFDKSSSPSWDNYYDKYPQSCGLYTFQRPGFNSKKNKAIIEYGWMAGPMTGEGYIVILEKGDNGWEITHRFVTWVS